ncbi:hypothetical protein K523DRAFT_231835 [Schizophyllum commune Tattone D]|nr:hypothetical protein K523DRAFT_231835 [Schizophyllum commune Tattone D]
MESGGPTVELLKEYKEQLMTAAAARDKVDGTTWCTRKTAGISIRTTRGAWAHIPQRSALGLAVGRLRDHETEEVSEKAKALVARWVAAAPAKKRQESPSKSTQISQKGAEPATVGVECYEEVVEQKNLSLKATIEHGEGADIGKLARTGTGDTKKSASMSVSARSVSKVSNAMSIDDVEAEATRSSQDPTKSSQNPRKPSRSTQPKISSTQPETSFTRSKTSSTQPKASQPKAKPPTPLTRTFETDDLGDASALHEVPLRALTIELFYDALAAGAGDMPPRSLLPKAMSVEDVIYLDTAASLDSYNESAHIDSYVRTAHSAFIALSTASDISTMRSDLLKGDISAEDFVDYILGEEEQAV